MHEKIARNRCNYTHVKNTVRLRVCTTREVAEIRAAYDKRKNSNWGAEDFAKRFSVTVKVVKAIAQRKVGKTL
jgi:hypothetical protein